MTRRAWSAGLVVASAVTLLASGTARAQSIGVGQVTGPRSARVQADLERALEAAGVDVASASQVNAAAGDLDANLDSDEGNRRVAAELGLAGVVGGRIRERGEGWRLDVWVRDGRSGEILEDTRYTGDSSGSVSREMRRELWDDFGSTIERLVESGAPAAVATAEPEAPGPAAAAEPAPELSPPAPAESAARAADSRDDASDVVVRREAGGRSVDRPSPFEIGVGAGIVNRNFSYNDDLFQSLQHYQLTAAPTVTGELNWYPAAHFIDGPGAHIGLGVRGELAYLLDSGDASGAQYATRYYSYDAGLRGRIPLGRHEITPLASVGFHTYEIDIPATETAAAIPDVDYIYLRLGADMRFELGSKVSLGMSGSYLAGLAAGEIESLEWFPNASYGGVEATGQLGYEVVDNLETQLFFGYRRFGFSLNPEAGLGRVAGGAVDQYYAGGVMLAYRVPERHAEATRSDATYRSAVAPVTHCGSPSVPLPRGLTHEAWDGASCQTRHQAGDAWSACLTRSDYTDDAGYGCPGEQLCCPGVD